MTDQDDDDPPSINDDELAAKGRRAFDKRVDLKLTTLADDIRAGRGDVADAITQLVRRIVQEELDKRK